MKLTNKNISSSLLIAIALLFSCQDENWNPAPDWNKSVGAATKIVISATDNNCSVSQGIATEFIEFNLDVDGYGVTKVDEVELQFTFTEAAPARVVGPVLLKKVNSFPSTVRITTQEAAAAIGGGFTVNDFQTNDSFRLTFPILTTDGRRLTVALNSELCVQPAQPLFGSCQIQWNVVN